MATEQNNIEREEDNYLACFKYEGHTTSPAEGFTTFQDEDGQNYFTMVNKAGKVLFRSEGYPTTAARDNGLASVQKNREIRERYSIVQYKTGHTFVILKAGNHQEIARSCGFKSDEELYALFPFMAEGFTGAISFAEPDPVIAAASNRNIDEYLDCEAYLGHTTSPETGFTTFTSAEGEHYFAVVGATGNVIFRSEGYPTAGARDNGIQSVIKNRDNKDRYKVIEEDGKYYVSLRAGNNQEIARSCAYDSAPDIDALYFAPVVAAATSNRNIDEYLDCEAYLGHSTSPETGFTTFTSAEGEHYFAVVGATGNVIFRSEGYPTTGARDNGIQSVLKNRDNKDRYKVIEEDGKYYVSLRAGNNQEIARSCAYDSAPDIDALYFAPVVAAAVSNKNIDEYLPCEAYKGHTESPYENFVTFKEGDSYYFALLDGDGEVKLRSESYPNTQVRDNGLQSVIKNKDIKERYKVIEEDGKYYLSLRAGNNQEIARSCAKESEAAIWGLFPYLAPLGALAFGAASAVAAPKVVPPVVIPPKFEAPVEPIAEVTPTYSYDEEEKGGGFRWWWLLPLLLIPLLWCIFKDCSCSKPAVVPVDSTSISVPAAVVPADTPSVAVPPPVVEATGCNCDASLHPVFDVKGTPKSLRRLGTNPEYGNSHGLSASQFYDKLKKRHASNSVDTKHLDALTKAMGYANGFADVTAEAFSEVKLPMGKSGNLGYSKAHKWGNYALNVDSEKDLEAFLVKAKNGCDVHFMKTCGNVMFFCDK